MKEISQFSLLEWSREKVLSQVLSNDFTYLAPLYGAEYEQYRTPVTERFALSSSRFTRLTVPRFQLTASGKYVELMSASPELLVSYLPVYPTGIFRPTFSFVLC